MKNGREKIGGQSPGGTEPKREKIVWGARGVDTGLWGPLRKTLQSVNIVLLPRLTMLETHHKCMLPPHVLRAKA